MSKLEDKLPSIPQYFKTYVDPKVDLDTTPSIPCPFHGEVNGKSFTYSKQLGVWRCWGACHCGGNVIDLHKLNYKIKSRSEAEESLCRLLGIKMEISFSLDKEEVEVDEKDVYRRRIYNAACKLANDPESYLELDYIVSKVPFDVKELEVFCASKGMPITSDDLNLSS